MIEKHLKLLGTQMKDIVTGTNGMVSSVCFDAYGCVQAVLSQKMSDDGKIPESRWFDIKRLRPNGKRLMDAPAHITTPPGQEAGPAEKPAFGVLPAP